VLEANQIDPEHAGALNRFLLQVHDRYLGCRFGYDDVGNLHVVHDIYPEDVSAKHIEDAMKRMDYATGALRSLMHQALESSTIPGDDLVDQAFGTRSLVTAYPDRVRRLANDLAASGYDVRIQPRRTTVTGADLTLLFNLLPKGDWLQVAAVIVEMNEIDDLQYLSKLDEFLMRLHKRYLGCRFGYHGGETLCIIYDVDPDSGTRSQVSQVITQLNWVAPVVLPLMKQVLHEGVIPGDDAIDVAFEGEDPVADA
jgi:hypothetical protein